MESRKGHKNMFENSSQNSESTAAIADSPKHTESQQAQEQRGDVSAKHQPDSRKEKTLQKIQNSRLWSVRG